MSISQVTQEYVAVWFVILTLKHGAIVWFILNLNGSYLAKCLF